MPLHGSASPELKKEANLPEPTAFQRENPKNRHLSMRCSRPRPAVPVAGKCVAEPRAPAVKRPASIPLEVQEYINKIPLQYTGMEHFMEFITPDV